MPVLPFGEKIWFKQIRDTKERKDKMDSEECIGIWLGHHRQINEHLVGTNQGVVRAYSIRRMADDRRWDKNAIKDMRGSPEKT